MKTSEKSAGEGSGKLPWRSAVRITVLTLGALLLIISGLLTFIISDDDRVRRVLQVTVTALTDRDFIISGEFRASFGREIRLYAEDITWANASWASTPYLLEVEKADAAFELASLLNPPVIISNAIVSNGKLEFEWDINGLSNWYFFPDRADDKPDDDKVLDELPLLLDTAQITNLEITFKDPDLTAPVVWTVTNAAQQQDQSNRLVIGADSRIEDRDIRLDAIIGPFPQLVVAGAVDLNGRIEGPNAVLELSGSTSELRNLRDLNLDANWNAAEAAELLDVLNLVPATSGPVALTATVSTDDGRIDGKVDGDIGEFLIDTTFNAPAGNLLTDLHIDFATEGPHAGVLGTFIGVRGLPDTPYKLTFKADTTPEGLSISDLYGATANAELTGEGLLAKPPGFVDANINLRIRGADMSRFQDMLRQLTFPVSPFAADITLQGSAPGGTDRLESKLSIGPITAQIDADLAERGDYLGSQLQFSLDVPDARSFADFFGLTLAKSDSLTATGKAEIIRDGLQLKDVTARIDGNTQTINGLIPRKLETETIQLTAQTDGSSFRSFTAFYLPDGIGPSAPFSIDGRIDIDPDGLWLDESRGKVGGTKIYNKTRINLANPVNDIEADLIASGPDIDEWLSDFITEQRIQDDFETRAVFKIYDDKFDINIKRLEVRDALLQGMLSTILEDDPDAFNYGFDLSANGKNLAMELPKFSAYEAAPVEYRLQAKGELSNDYISLEKVAGNLGSAIIDASGSLGLSEGDSARRFVIDAYGDRLSDMGSIEGWDLVDETFDIAVTLNSQDGLIQAENLNMVVGPNDLRGDFSLADGELRPKITAKLESDNFDLGAVLTKQQNDDLDAFLEDPDPDPDGRVIPESILPIEWFTVADADLDIKIDTGSRKGENLSDILFKGTLLDGALDIPKFTATSTLGGIETTIKSYPSNDTYFSEISITARKVRLPMYKDQVTDNVPYEGQDIDVYLSGYGVELRDFLSDVDGFVWMRGGAKQFENVKYKSLFGDAFTEIGKTINPFFEKDPYTNMICEVLLFEIEDGTMQTSPIVFIKTDKLNISSAGVVDLKDETLRLGIETTPRKGIGLSASDLFEPFIRVGGTLDEPKPEVDPKGSLIQGTAAFYTAGLSILARGLYNRWVKADTDCSEYIEIAREARIERDPEHVPAD